MKKLNVMLVGILFLSWPINGPAQEPIQIKNVALFLHEGVEILDFAGPMEVFVQAGFNVYTVGESKDPLIAMRTLKVIPDYSVDDFPTPDIASFYGGGLAYLKSREHQFQKWVKSLTSDAKVLFSVCSGAFFLAENGSLNGKKATTFHTLIDTLQNRFPEIEVHRNVRFVDNGDVITTAGISAGIDGALHLVAKVQGEAAARSIARRMEYDKWIPEEGLIIKSELMSTAEKEGLPSALHKFVEKSRQGRTYKGELIALGKTKLAAGMNDQALDIFEYVVKHHHANATDFAALGTVMRTMGQKAPPSEKEFLELISAGNIEKAQEIFRTTKVSYPNWIIFRQGQLNRQGYQFLAGKDVKTALRIFQLNVEAYPNEWNTYDSLAEAHMYLGENDKAISNYMKSLDLNPENSNATKMLQKLKGTN